MNYRQLIGNLAVLIAGAYWSMAAHAALVAHFAFDETSGTTTTASIGGVSGTLNAGAAFSPGSGVLGGALNIGTGGLVSMGTAFPLDSGSFSIQVWIKLAAGATGPQIPVARHHSTEVAGYIIHAGNISDGCGGANGQAGFYTAYPCSGFSSALVNDGGWHQMVGVFDASTGISSIFVDGAIGSSSPAGNDVVASMPGTEFLIGGINSSNGTPTNLFSGLVDELMIFDSALTSSDVASLYRSTLNPPVNGVDEPGTLLLALLGFVGLARMRRPS